MKRRDFIKSTALAGGGLMLSFHATAIRAASAPENDAAADALGDFLKIMPDGTVHFQFVKHEMGQGISTAMAQLIGEELHVNWDKVKIEFPLADMKRYQNAVNGGHDTGGSCTIIYQWDLLRKAGATARQLLIEAASSRWKIPVEKCYAENHFLVNSISQEKLSFGEVVADAARLKLPDQVILKDKKDYVLIGKAKSSKLLPSIVSGDLKYGIDVKLPGMLCAIIVRCPVFKGKLKSYDASAALKVKGVRKVFTTKPIAGLQTHAPYMPYDIREGIVIVADSFWAATKGRKALTVLWDDGPNGALSSEDFERMAEKRARQRTDPTGFTGDANALSNINNVRKTLRASYVFPHQLHSCMEPLNCTAHVRQDGCEIWMGSQAPHLIVSEIRRIFNFPEENIKVHLFPSGGGFGRRYYPDMAVEAAFISKEAGNVPVKMIWTREDDHQCNLAHLFQYMEYQASIDAKDQLYAFYEKEIRTYTWAAKYQDPQLPLMAYNIPNIRFDFDDMIEEELVHSSAWRGVIFHGRFLVECFIDEIASELKRDPLEFRLSMLEGDRQVYGGSEYPLSSLRMARVLRLASEKAGWGKALSKGQGMGIALCPYANTCCALIAEVTVSDQKLTINKITIAVDCGQVVNPSGAENQITGGIIWSLTALFYGGLPIRNGRAVQTNFHQNKLLRMNESPPIDVHFVESEDKLPWGIGEVSSPMGVPGVLNAIFAATGKRIRKIPLTVDAFQD